MISYKEGEEHHKKKLTFWLEEKEQEKEDKHEKKEKIK